MFMKYEQFQNSGKEKETFLKDDVFSSVNLISLC